MRSFALCLALVVSLLAVANAAEKDDLYLDKEWQAQEPWWNPIPGDRVLADVPESEPANNACPGQAFSCGDVLRPASLTAGDNDYIYFTASAGDIISFGTDADGGPTADTYIHLYNADCSTQLAFDDDGGPGLASLLSYCATYSGTYVGRIRHYSASGTGTYKAFVTCASGGGHADVCASAAPLPCGSVSLSGHTGCSTNNYSPPSTGSCTRYTAAGRDQVVSLTVTAGGSVDLTYTSSADGSIYIYDAAACGAPIGANCIAGDDSTLAGQPETLQYTFSTSGTYYLILDSYGTNSAGSWTLTGIFDCGPVAVEPRTWTHVKRIFR
jgi:hypothetical protein